MQKSAKDKGAEDAHLEDLTTCGVPWTTALDIKDCISSVEGRKALHRIMQALPQEPSKFAKALCKRTMDTYLHEHSYPTRPAGYVRTKCSMDVQI